MKIAHFMKGFGQKGGVSSYVAALASIQIVAGHEVFIFDTLHDESGLQHRSFQIVSGEDDLFNRCQSLGIDLLHYHVEPTLLPTSEMPVVCTVHGHSPHCVSGGLYLTRTNKPCPRTYNPLGCLNGHIWDRCGSVRPQNVLKNLRRMKRQMAILPKITTIAIGHSLKDRMVRAGYPAGGITVVPNFTDILADSREIPVTDLPEFLFVGRIEKLKGVELLLRAVKMVSSAVILNIAGDGSGLVSAHNLARSLGIMERVNFLGWVDHEKKIELIQRARAVIVPSIWPEPFGIVAIEAGACARPAIVSGVGELPYIIQDGKNGLIVRVGDIAALGGAIDKLATNREYSSEMGHEGQRKYRECYTRSIHLAQIEQVYKIATYK